MRNRLTAAVLTVAALLGIAIGYIDSRPTWDDTGITVATIFLSAAILAGFRPRLAWLIGLLVGAPVLVFNLVTRGGFASAVALVIGLVGAGAGSLIGRTVHSGNAGAP